MSALEYVKLFVISQEFQEKQPWVRLITRKCSFVSHHVWTSSRFFGGGLTIVAEWYSIYLSIFVFLLFAWTDWIDGKVARFRHAQNGKLGAVLDGAADKFFVIPIIGWWGGEFIISYLIYLMAMIEFGGYFVIYVINGKKVTAAINSVISFFWPGRKLPDPMVKTDIYEHNLIGKIKFTLQVVMIVFIWVAKVLFPDWAWWPLWMNLTASIVSLMAFFSIACKVNPAFIRYLADFVTLGNVICGGISIYLAGFDPKIAAALIMVAAAFDIVDGYIARKTKKGNSVWGAYFDDIGDFVSFALAPAWLYYSLRMPGYLSVVYVVATAIRLYYFTKKKAVAEGIFYGVPSTAVAIFLASVILWNNSEATNLAFWMLAGAALEVMFFFRWHHFRNFPQLPRTVKAVFAAVMFTAITTSSFGEGMSALFGIYLLTFSRPVAEWAWKW
jgi:CDP-diacylglycerol---serine O-phosphatidyltransferase